MHCVTGYQVFRRVSDERRHQRWALTDQHAVCMTGEVQGALVWAGRDEVMTLKPPR